MSPRPNARYDGYDQFQYLTLSVDFDSDYEILNHARLLVTFPMNILCGTIYPNLGY